MQNTKNSKTNKPSPLTPLPPPLRQQVFPAALTPSPLPPPLRQQVFPAALTPSPLPPPLRQQVFPAVLTPSLLIPLTHKVRVSVKVIVKEKEPSTLNSQPSHTAHNISFFQHIIFRSVRA